jgi:hypothetical protein
MKKTILFIFCFLIADSVYPQSPKSGNRHIQKQKLKSVLSPQVLDLLNNCDSIDWYLLDPLFTDTLSNPIEKYGEVLAEVSDTCAERTDALIATLTYPKSFANSNNKKNSTFLPDIACIIKSKGRPLVFTYSFYCDLCRFNFDGKMIEYNGELIRKSILQIVMEIFPKDRYLRKISGKTR